MNEFSVQKQQELFLSRSATQEFLFSKVDSKPKDEKLSRLPFTGSDVLKKAFPDLAAGESFMRTAMEKLENSSTFGAMVIQIDDPAPAEETSETNPLTDYRMEIAGAIQDVCKNEKGMWGQLEEDTFGCFFPERNGLACIKTAKKLRKNIAAGRNTSVSIGIAAFPTISYEKPHILENAYKALVHAGFFGSNSMVTFDSVSLNISGDKLYQAGDIKGAIKEFKQALLLDPSNINVYNSLGVCYAILGSFEESLVEFRTAISLDPGEVMALYNAGLVNTMLGHNDKALKYFLDANGVDDDVFEVVLHTGKLYTEMGNPQKSKAFIEKAVKLRPESGPALRCLGEYYMAVNMINKAISTYSRAIKLNSNDAAALSALGHLYGIQNKDLEIATMFCQQSIQISPEDGLFRHRLGRLYLKQNRLDEALKEFKTAMAFGYDSSEYVEQAQSRLTAKAK